jgi:DNA-binding IclR family transcriptional regulator
VSVAEYDTDIVVVSAPIFDIHYKVVASCSIAALESRVKTPEQIQMFSNLIMETSQEISKKLGAIIPNGRSG